MWDRTSELVLVIFSSAVQEGFPVTVKEDSSKTGVSKYILGLTGTKRSIQGRFREDLGICTSDRVHQRWNQFQNEKYI